MFFFVTETLLHDGVNCAEISISKCTSYRFDRPHNRSGGEILICAQNFLKSASLPISIGWI